jgi:dihydrofolate reductase
MSDTKPQTADGKVLLHFAMSLDGFVAGPDHAMDWMTGVSVRPGLHDEYVTTTGAILGGRNGWDQAIDGSRPYGGAWQGPIFVLTHHPEDATPADGVTFLTCDPAEAVRIGLTAAGGKNLEVFSPTIGRQLLELGLIDEIDLHIVPVLLGEGIRLYDNPGGKPVRLHRVGESDPMSAVNVRYRPATLWTASELSRSTALTCALTPLATRLTRRSCSSAVWAPRWTGGRRNSASGWRRAGDVSSGTTIVIPGGQSATQPGRPGTRARTWRPT